MKKDSIVVYHGNCPDGFGAALVCWLALGDRAEYLPYQHGAPAPDATGKHLYIVDFSFPLPVMEQLNETAASITLLDHHITAERNLASFSCKCGRVHFDLKKSGASLAWNHFYPNEPLPRLIAHIEDRDIWRWTLPDSAHFLSLVDTVPFEFEQWKPLLELSDEGYEKVVRDGELMHRKFMSLCRQIADTAVTVELDGHEGLMVNIGAEFSSDVGNLLATRSGTFGLMWSLEKGGALKVSLRSVAGFDVEAIAVKFGGGGHTNAAAFRLSSDRFADLVARKITP
jgi:oligoribonuclease NrnB/cAMP/cGMP phosphodiesterase (DHH superfamily)